MKIPVAIINYNGERTLARTIESLYSSKDLEVEIFVFDDCSTDGAIERIRELYPKVKIYVHPYNTRNPNVLRNLAIKEIDSEIIFITDNDIVYDQYCLGNLIQIMKNNTNVATCSPRLMYLEDKERTFFAGAKIHYAATAIGKYRGEIVDHSNKKVETNCGGGILLVDRNKAIEVGLFDEDYGLAWGDDGEFYHRLLLKGYECLYIPNAFGYHEFKPFSAERSYRAIGQVTNRLMFIGTHYSKRTILLLSPALIVYELMEFTFMLMKKMPVHFFKGELAFLKKYDSVKAKRKKNQKLRKVSDKQVLYSGEIFISPSLIGGNKIIKFLISIIQKFFAYYWKIVSPLIP